MHVKVTTSGSRRHIQLVESFCDQVGKVKKRTIATLGRLEQLSGDLDAVLRGLLKVADRDPAALDPPAVQFDSATAFGDL